MAIRENTTCSYLYRKPGKDTVHCTIQRDKGAKWDFCKYQYFCRHTRRYEASKETTHCPLIEKERSKEVVTKNTKNQYDITGTNLGVLYGLSTDTKPTDDTIANGYTFCEMDTQKEYLYDAENQEWKLWKDHSNTTPPDEEQ